MIGVDSIITLAVLGVASMAIATLAMIVIESITSLGIIIGNWRSPNRNPSAQAYITISRAKSRFSVAVLKEFTDADAETFTPSAAMLTEDERLQHASTEFVNQFRKANC